MITDALLNTMLVGFFGFAALHSLCLWWWSRRETVYLAFACQCGLFAVLAVVRRALASADTIEAYQAALDMRTTTLLLLIVATAWVLSTATAVRPRAFLTATILLCLPLVVINLAGVPLNGIVTGLRPVQLAGGEAVVIAQRGPAGWWMWLVYAVAVAVLVFAFVVAARLRVQSRLASLLVALATCGGVVAVAASARIDLWGSPRPYAGTAAPAVFVGLLSLFMSREYARRGERLAAMESRHRGILESSLDGLIVMNSAGEILEFNAAAEVLFGYGREDVIGKLLAELIIPPSLRRAHWEGLEHYLKTGESRVIGQRIEVPALRADGSEIRVELSVVSIAGSKPPLFAGGVRDITERLKLEEHIRQAQKMEAVGQLAGGVAHDFNNLLTVISGYSELLLRTLPAGQTAKMVGDIHEAAERAASLTRQLLAFSRRQVLEPRELDLNVVVRDTETMLRRLIGEDVQLTTALSRDVNPVKVDAGQISQVVMNLALNGRDAMPIGGRLTIATDNVVLDAASAGIHPDAQSGHYVRLTVTDTGFGMTPEVKARIFEPFFTTKGVGKGTGLGLAVVHGIVEQSGGHIDVESRVDGGTTIAIYLPAVCKSSKTQPFAGTYSDPYGKETILLVEDEEGVRNFAALALEQFGYTTLKATGGQDALRLLESRTDKIDLLVTDVVMPEMSGRQLAEILRSRHIDLKVLFLSGHTDDEIVRHGVLQADVAFLQKPFTPTLLASKVREALDQN